MITLSSNTCKSLDRAVCEHFGNGCSLRHVTIRSGLADSHIYRMTNYSEVEPRTQGDTPHIEVRADAKYKEQVADNVLMEGPVNAEIDYHYASAGRTRESKDAITRANCK